MTIKIWHLGCVVFVALLAMAVFVGYSLAPKQAAGASSAFTQLAQKDLLISKLQTQIATIQQGQALEKVVLTSAYRAFQDRANKSAAQANVRAVLPDVESYNADNVAGSPAASDPDFATSNTDNGYEGMTAAGLRTTYDQAFPSAVWIVGSPDVTGTPAPVGAGITAAGAPTATNYCIVSQNGNWYSWKLGPGGVINVTESLAAVCQS